MTRYFNKITVTWRVGPGSNRYCIGTISEDGEFTYNPKEVEKAKEFGFTGYPGIPFNAIPENAVELFFMRLINFERKDLKPLLDFWEVEESNVADKMYLLAMTQGKMATDTYEFLASFKPIKGLVFVTEIAGLSHSKYDLSKIKNGDILSYKKEPENSYDPKAIAVYKDNEKIGYIKMGHLEVFNKNKYKPLNIQVKDILNGELYVKVSN